MTQSVHNMESTPLEAVDATGWRRLRLVLWQEKLTLLGALILAIYLILALIAPWIAPVDPNAINLNVMLSPPTPAHPFGTDSVGRDIFSRTLVAARIDIGLALGAVILSITLGTLLGMAAGYAGGWLDEVIMRSMDILQSFPAFILALGVVAALGQGLFNILVVVAFINIPSYARLIRTEFLSNRERQYADAARMVGNSHTRIVFRHLLPNSVTPLLAIASLNFGWAILTTAGLSFLGIGVRPPTAEWGQMIATGSEELVRGIWWTSFFPGMALFVFVLGCNLLGDGVQKLLDPRSW
ncbi:ABC transporter permease subunit [bacterium]|nr:ABC transporter permease subunit [bacterium]